MADEETLRLVPCPKCKSGPNKDCPLCQGSGMVDAKKLKGQG